MNWLLPVLLQALAFGVAMAEVIVPSFGMLSVLCLGLFGYSWYHILSELPRGAAVAFGIADLLLLPFGIKLAFSLLGKSPFSHRTDLGKGSGLEGSDSTLKAHVGASALVEAALRPTGKIRLGDDTFEAQTSGEYIDKGATVTILSVSGTRFHVEKALST